ncbi:hypothetical protein GOODEAATRI_024585 [Goodea atripinnis]|uniref:Uncharacterized protein n=1 Tax=Goodea atripinnis TaxID=208336 RepID=A0ABV0PRB5_9TELE
MLQQKNKKLRVKRKNKTCPEIKTSNLDLILDSLVQSPPGVVLLSTLSFLLLGSNGPPRWLYCVPFLNCWLCKLWVEFRIRFFYWLSAQHGFTFPDSSSDWLFGYVTAPFQEVIADSDKEKKGNRTTESRKIFLNQALSILHVLVPFFRYSASF